MTRNGKPLVLVALALGGLVLMDGCSKKPSRPPIDEAAIAGKWIEIPVTETGNPRAAAGAGEKYRRYVEINADHTFVFSLRDKAGKPKGKQKAEGTWKVNKEKNVIEFEVTNNTFDKSDEKYDWVPASSVGVHKGPVKGQGETDILSITDQTDTPYNYIRA